MRTDQVPQDSESIYEGHKKAVYALDSKGAIASTGQAGWAVETYFNDLAWQDVGRHIQGALDLFQRGKVSPLKVHCEARMTSLWVLSRDAGVPWWRAWLDMYPRFFGKMGPTRRSQYERALHLPPGGIDNLEVYRSTAVTSDLFARLEGSNT